MSNESKVGQGRLERKLQVRDFKLNALLDITMAVNNNVGVEEILEKYRQTLQNPPLNISKLLLFSRFEKWQCILKFGVTSEIPEIEDQDLFSESGVDSFTLSNQSKQESLNVRIPVYHEEEPIAYVLVGDVEESAGISPVIKHMKFIQTFTNLIVVAIKNRQLVEENLRQERVKKELELAAEMQAMLVPNRLPSDELFDVSAIYKPHQQVGGDYYDFIEFNKDEVMFCVADVSGKGVSAAFLMSNFQAYLMAIFRYLDFDLDRIVYELNARVMQSAMGEKYITLFIATYNKKTRELNYVNCGHNPPVLLQPDGKESWLTEGSIGLGMFDEIPVMTMGKKIIKPGTLVVCYTDGLVELEDENLEEFGTARLEQITRDNFNLSMEDLNAKIMLELNKFRGEMPYIDDTALLSCRFL
jgi:phosphoserine phosphatase RsbU/P